MAKPMKTPGAPGAKHSPLAPLGNQGVRMSVDDASSKIVMGALRPRRAGEAADGDAALGTKGTRSRTATNASAQFRITAKMPGATEPEAAKNLANSPIMPAVMGSKQSFIRGMQGQGL